MKTNIPCVLSIAGTDPTGGAGIQADIKTISATGAYAASVITAIVAQNTMGVQAIYDISNACLEQQLHSVFSDLDIQAIKIGMLQDARIIEVVASHLEKIKIQHIVFDPVMVAKDGSLLLDLATIQLLKARIFKQVSLITPNLFEAEQLLGITISSLPEMEAAAQELGKQFKINVLVKGGHLTGSSASDVLYDVSCNQCFWFHDERIVTKNTHGTGCSLSSAIASNLAQRLQLTTAIAKAKRYLSHAIQASNNLAIGHGNGPVDHFYYLRSPNNDSQTNAVCDRSHHAENSSSRI